jgi:DNA-binding XRE family transcriptional regulator
MFKRAFKEVEVTRTDDEGNSYTELKTVPISWVAKRATANHAKVTISASKTGVDVDDNEYVPKMFTSSMGTDIMLRRNELDLTQEDVARAMNVDVNTIRAIEVGGKVAFNPQDPLVNKLSNVLKTGIKYIE